MKPASINSFPRRNGHGVPKSLSKQTAVVETPAYTYMLAVQFFLRPRKQKKEIVIELLNPVQKRKLRVEEGTSRVRTGVEPNKLVSLIWLGSLPLSSRMVDTHLLVCKTRIYTSINNRIYNRDPANQTQSTICA